MQTENRNTLRFVLGIPNRIVVAMDDDEVEEVVNRLVFAMSVNVKVYQMAEEMSAVGGGVSEGRTSSG